MRQDVRAERVFEPHESQASRFRSHDPRWRRRGSHFRKRGDDTARSTISRAGYLDTNSESLHRRPVRSKRQSTTPWNCCAPDRRSVVPKPSRVGGLGSGPPLSTQSNVSWPETSVHAISIRPSEFERAPYFTAFVVSSWTTSARKTASSDGQSISSPWSWARERP
jgi:hypothetical protein